MALHRGTRRPGPSQATVHFTVFWFSGNWTIGVCRLALCSALRAGVFEAWQVFQSDEIGEWDGALIVRPIPVLIAKDEPDRGIPWTVALPQVRPPFRPVKWILRLGGRCCQLSPFPARLAGGFEFAVALIVDCLLAPFKHVAGRDVADGAVQATRVVMLNIVS